VLPVAVTDRCAGPEDGCSHYREVVMKVVVIGATGTIGKALVTALSGREVRLTIDPRLPR